MQTTTKPTELSSTLTAAKKTIRVLFAGGGTGGHVCPALAVAEALENLGQKFNFNIELLFLGTGREVECRLVKAAGRPHEIVAPTHFRKGLAKWPGLAVAGAKGMAKALSKVAQFKPDIALGLGGYGSFPGLLAARVFGAPYVLFEPNAVPGRANRLAAKGAKAVFTQYSVLESILQNAVKIENLGVPIRSAAQVKKESAEAKLELGLDPKKPCLLIVGGSQGAKPLNDWAKDVFAKVSPEFSVVHVAGSEKQAAELNELYTQRKINHKVFAFTNDMAILYAASDLVLSRAGGATIAEITAAAKPSILIPYPHAVDDHQRANARGLGDAAIVVEQTQLDINCYDEIAELLDTTGPNTRLEALANAAREISKPQAANSYAKAMIKMVAPELLDNEEGPNQVII